jgi:hypothetical protein
MDRDRWLVVISAALGVGVDACAREAEPVTAPVAAFEVPSAARSASAPPIVMGPPAAPATDAPDEKSCAVRPAPSASCSGGACASAAAQAPPQPQPQPAGSQSTIGALAPRFRACFKSNLASDPNLQGAVTLTLDVAADGSVASVSPGPTTLPSSLVLCIVNVAKNARFAAPGAQTQVVVPLRFTK